MNSLVFLAGMFGAALMMWLSVTVSQRNTVNRRVNQTKARTTVTTVKAIAKPTTNSALRIISERPFVREI